MSRSSRAGARRSTPRSRRSRDGTNAHVVGVQADVGNAADVQRAYDEAMAALRQGRHRGEQCRHLARPARSRISPTSCMQADLDLKLFAAIRFARLVWPQMKERRGGRIINMLNIGAKAPRAQVRADLDLARRRHGAHQGAVGRGRAAQHPGQRAARRADRGRPARAGGEAQGRAARRLHQAGWRRTFRSAASARRRSSPTWRVSSRPTPARTSPAPRSTSTAGVSPVV